MSPNAGIIQQAQAQISSAKQLLADLGQYTTNSGAYTDLSNWIWTAENRADALVRLHATSPDDLSVALRGLSRAVATASAELQRLRQTL